VGSVAEMAPSAATAIPTGDPPALSAAIIDLLQSPQSRERLGKAAHAWAREYNADWTASQFEDLYQRAIDA
jgi:glycosyltransferase involved in cell wall biosynthesis